MVEPKAGGSKKWEQERSKRHVTHKIKTIRKRWKKRRIQGISQRKKQEDRKLLV